MSEMAQVDKVIFPFDQAVRHLLIRSAAKKRASMSYWSVDLIFPSENIYVEQNKSANMEEKHFLKRKEKEKPAWGSIKLRFWLYRLCFKFVKDCLTSSRVRLWNHIIFLYFPCFCFGFSIWVFVFVVIFFASSTMICDN
jgi:hypothetical protein